jgi:outer membrane protein assembly factor BamB
VILTVCVFALGPALVCAENWPGFRGPTGQGVSTERDLPTQWSTTENVAWKTAIPGAGWSSPIVYGDRVFVTTAEDEGASCHVICLDRTSGKILWNVEVFRQELRRKQDKNSFATPTPVTDGERVYAVFADGGIAAVDYEGRVVWTNREVKHYSQHGLGASPILHGDLVIMPFDGSSDGDKSVGWKKPWDHAVILAVDKKTGVARWRGRRGASRIAHVTPNVLRQDGAAQLISGAGDVVQGFDLASGERVWSVFSQGEGVVPSIVLGDGLIYSASGYEKPTIRAIRPGGKGDVTATHIAWEQTSGVPSQSSMLYVRPHLFAMTEGGVATCFDAETGKVLGRQRVGGNHCASPVLADGRIYFLSEQGACTIVEATPEMKIIAKNELGERCQASIAISKGNLFIRTDKHVFCIR